MIHRQNWLDVKEYAAYVARIGRSTETVLRVRGLLRHLLDWADDTPFSRAREIDPAFPTYLLTARGDGRDKALSAASMKKACEVARRFFEWVQRENHARYRSISMSWVDTVRPGISHGLHSEYREHTFWELEQVRQVAGLVPRNLTEERDRAALCFLFLSAMRAQAFVSLPVKAVDIRRKEVMQLPELGVHTKNGKAAKTQLMRLPDLMEIVEAWDRKARDAGAALWYPRIDRWHRFIAAEAELNWLSRTELLSKGLRKLCARAGVPYLSPHKLRHGHTVYMMRRVKDMKGLKSLSQNLMHSNVGITDAIYGRLVSTDIADMYDEIEE